MCRYRAVLETRRDVLVKGLDNAPLPSLLNVQIELRKCCNHPFLIKGVEESVTQDMSEGEARQAMLSASGKLVLLDKLLPKLRSEGHRVLLFSQFKIMLNILAGAKPALRQGPAVHSEKPASCSNFLMLTSDITDC